MLKKISWRDFQNWQFFGNLEPFGEWRADMRAASIAAQVGNMFSKSPKPISYYALDFGSKISITSRKNTWQENKIAAKMIAYAFARPLKEKH
jgi:hypothetical protein